MLQTISIRLASSLDIQSLQRSRSDASFDKNNDEKFQLARTKLTQVLQGRLSQNNSNSQDAAKASKYLEELLFQSAASLEIYQDMSTLESRIRTIVAVKLQRRMHSSSKKDRSKVLCKTLGPKRYQQAQRLVKEIQLAKHKKVATMKCMGGACSRPFRESFPTVVRHLFFETALMDAFERSPVEKIPSLGWNGLLADAEGNLRAYQESGF
jgi:hypothetical protein